MDTTTSRYTAELARRLRWRNLPGAAVDDAVTVVESHVRDTGEDPVAAFGPARTYARTFPRRSGPARHAGWYVAGWLVASLAGALLVAAVLTGPGETLPLGVDARTGIVLGSAVLAAWVVTLLVALLRVGTRRARSVN